MARRTRHYKGSILDEPMESLLPVENLFPEARNGAWFEERKAKRTFQVAGYFQRIDALLAHSGIEPDAPGRFRDLALSLAWHHEREQLIVNGTLRLAGLFSSEGINPDDEDADLKLALRLAGKHVPGFQFESVKSRGTRYPTCNLVHLLRAVVRIREDLIQRHEKPTVNAIAQLVRNDTALRKIVGGGPADRLREVLLEMGNKKQGEHPRPLSDRTLRDLIKLLLDPGPLVDGEVTALQLQIIFDVYPRYARFIAELAERATKNAQNISSDLPN